MNPVFTYLITSTHAYHGFCVLVHALCWTGPRGLDFEGIVHKEQPEDSWHVIFRCKQKQYKVISVRGFI